MVEVKSFFKFYSGTHMEIYNNFRYKYSAARTKIGYPADATNLNLKKTDTNQKRL